MFFLAAKKAFFDAWDNLGVLILSNLAVLMVIVLGLWPMSRLLELQNLKGFLILLVLIPLLLVTVGVVSALMSSVADYNRVPWGDAFQAVKKTWKASLAFSAAVMGGAILSFVGMSYYIGTKSFLGIAGWALLFWISLAAYLTAIWFFAVRNRLTGSFGKSLKKCGLIMLDNLGLSLFGGLIMVPLQLFLWPLTAFAAFGPAGIELYLNVSLRLLMYKYDWLEANPQARRKDIPWHELLIDEKERVGKRTLKGMIFPWKE